MWGKTRIFTIIVSLFLICPGIFLLVPEAGSEGSDGRAITNITPIPSEDDIEDPGSLATYNISLDHGWNLISVPLIQADQSLDQVLSSINGKWDYIRIYDPLDPEPWKSNCTYKPDSLNDVDTLNRKMGFWINIIESNVTLTISGNEPITTIIPLYAGWNLVGYPSFLERPISMAMAGINVDRVEIGDSGEPHGIKEIPLSDIMLPGKGYWVHLLNDATWIPDNIPPIPDPYPIYGSVYLYDGTSTGGYDPLPSSGGATVQVTWWNKLAGWETINTSPNTSGQYSVDITNYTNNGVVYINATFDAPYGNKASNKTHIDTMQPGLMRNLICGIPYEVVITNPLPYPQSGRIIPGIPFTAEYEIRDIGGVLAKGYFTHADGPMMWSSTDPAFVPPPPAVFEGTATVPGPGIPGPGQGSNLLVLNYGPWVYINISEGGDDGNPYLTPWGEFYMDPPDNTIPGWLTDWHEIMLYCL
jgi:hypothetical protein